MTPAFTHFEAELRKFHHHSGHALLEAMTENGSQSPVKATAFAQLLNDFYYLLQWLWRNSEKLSYEQGLFIKAFEDLIASIEGEEPSENSVQAHMRLWQELINRPDYADTLTFILEPTPLTVRLLERFDTEHRSAHAALLKTMMLRFAHWGLQQHPSLQATAHEKYKALELMLEPNTPSTPPQLPTLLPETLPPDQLHALVQRGELAGNAAETQETVESLLAKLDRLVGLEPVKAEVFNLVNLLKLNKLRQTRGFPTLDITRHMVFYGNPGTGKTTVARLLAKIFKALGVLRKGHLVETDRSGLVAAYVGQTALKVKRVVNQAEDGVLFIDEAYALVRGENDFGSEAVETLIKLMEDRRETLVVIVAGYTEKMTEFIASNPGLKSRFTRFLAFNDYDAHQLCVIFETMVADAGMQLTPVARAVAIEAFERVSETRGEGFGNARFARNSFERATMAQANRLAAQATVSDADIATLQSEDVQWAVQHSDPMHTPVPQAR